MDWDMFWKEKLQSYVEIVDKEEEFKDDKKTVNVYYMPFLLQELITYISHVTLWSKSLKEFLPNKITHVKYKQDQMTNFDMELYFKIRKASKDETNLPVGEFITKTNLNRQANQRKFVQV